MSYQIICSVPKHQLTDAIEALSKLGLSVEVRAWPKSLPAPEPEPEPEPKAKSKSSRKAANGKTTPGQIARREDFCKHHGIKHCSQRNVAMALLKAKGRGGVVLTADSIGAELADMGWQPSGAYALLADLHKHGFLAKLQPGQYQLPESK